MILNDFLSRLDKVNQRGHQFTALCPSHDDKNPSLAVAEKSGKILIKCWSGCTTDEIISALGLKLSDLFVDNGLNNQQRQMYSKKMNKNQLRKLLSFELLELYWILTSRITSYDLARDTKYRNVRPDFAPIPEEIWERELLAVKRIREAINELY